MTNEEWLTRAWPLPDEMRAGKRRIGRRQHTLSYVKP
jgi:hypothetical protein